ncbi:MAG TPA: hypothetical protein VMF88_01330 [Bacteroidota bacterium]|nr:hypothetical protein [Bacteroidota bacterium]
MTLRIVEPAGVADEGSCHHRSTVSWILPKGSPGIRRAWTKLDAEYVSSGLTAESIQKISGQTRTLPASFPLYDVR